MNLAILYSRAQWGVDAPLVTVETHISNGLPRFNMVGLPETVVKESKERVRSALMTSGFDFPHKRITVNLAPADIPKEGGGFDLAIALGILAASRQLPPLNWEDYEFAGELALSGKLRLTTGIVPFAIETHRAKRTLITSMENGDNVAFIEGLSVLVADHLLEVTAHFLQKKPLFSPVHKPIQLEQPYLDLKDVHGQTHAKRSLEIAAAGGHSLLMVGPPGTGKTLLANRLPGILPPLTQDEALQIASIYSMKANSVEKILFKRPFRSPHHTASSVALVGGSSPPRPGEVSLAHNGILFLDELPEFNRKALETLREPLEAGAVTISRAAQQARFPALFQLVAAMNPCPCGHFGNPQKNCNCSEEQIKRYQQRLSGPFLDRIDLHVTVPALPTTFLLGNNTATESSDMVRRRVCTSRDLQRHRQGCINAHLSQEDIQKYCQISEGTKNLLITAIDKLNLSARSYHRTLKVARTLADLESSDNILEQHITEALQYRRGK